jgi:hypothetical protein
MYGANTYVIRTAGPRDADALKRLAALDSREPVAAPALIGMLEGEPAAALSLADGRLVADPFKPTGHLAAHLRLRAAGMRAAAGTPSLAVRVRARLRIGAHPVTA